MTNRNVYREINDKLDFLLEDHGVDFDDSNLKVESLDTLHNKVDSLLEAHNCAIPDVENNVAGLQPKLNMLIQGHGAEFDDTDLDQNSFGTVRKKLDVLHHEHGK